LEASRDNWQPFKVGLLLVAVSWFVYVTYDNVLGIYNRHTTLPLVKEDIAATYGIGFAVAAAAIAVFTILFYVVRKDLTKPETTMSVRAILFLEGLYFVLGFLPAVYVEGIPGGFHFGIQRFFQITVPCLVDGIAIPIVLAILILNLNPNKPAKNTIKWALIAGTVYLFAFWINNAGNWIAAAIAKGASYLIDYPLNMLSFVLTTVGLLLLSVYAAYFSRKTIGKESLSEADYGKVGLILIATGMYLTFTLLLYFLFGAVGGWGAWYAWFLGHGYLDLWGLTLPFIGLPLLFYSLNKKDSSNNLEQAHSFISRKQLNVLLYLTEGLGIIFYSVLSAAYYWVIPSTKVLTGEPAFKIPITIFGLAYFIMVLLVLALSAISRNQEKKTAKQPAL
jgi:hypothetical protein